MNDLSRWYLVYVLVSAIPVYLGWAQINYNLVANFPSVKLDIAYSFLSILLLAIFLIGGIAIYLGTLLLYSMMLDKIYWNLEFSVRPDHLNKSLYKLR